VADNAWSQSTCRGDVYWYGVPGAGSYLWTQRFGTYWVGGGVYAKFAAVGYECGGLGAPVKEYQWLSEFSAYGQWFQGGAIYYQGGWKVAWGDYGQTAGRLAGEVWPEAPDDAEVPPDAPSVMDAPAFTLNPEPELPVDDDPPAELDKGAQSEARDSGRR
jgi:hypothetical protein